MEIKKSRLLSADKVHELNVVTWIPDGEIVGIVQIVHGMQEYVERYDAFAKFLNEKGYLVVGEDHLGHGDSVKDKSEYGYIAPKNGARILVEDVRHVFVTTKSNYRNVPYYILGHSFGSYILRAYLTLYSSDLDGAIVMGTGYEPKINTSLGKFLASVVAGFKGWKYRSPFIANSSQGKAYKNFDTTGTDHARSWLCTNTESVDKYYADPKCGIPFTLNGYYALFNTVEAACDTSKMGNIKKSLPMLFVSGEQDPVGNLGEGVKSACVAYKNAGLTNLIVKLYKGDRHEILNEKDSDKVMKDILTWLKKI